MNRTEQLGKDLSYVRSVVDRAEVSASPPSIYLLWAAISLIGFTLQDFDAELAGQFWATCLLSSSKRSSRPRTLDSTSIPEWTSWLSSARYATVSLRAASSRGLRR